MHRTLLPFAGSILLLGCAETIPTDTETTDALPEETAQSSEALNGVIRVNTKEETEFWTGAVDGSDAPLAGAPPECATVACDHKRLKIDLPPGTFSNPNRPGGVQVAIRWFGSNPGHTLPPGVPGCCGEFDTLNLYVYKDGNMVASSPGIIAVSQSTLIPSPQNGFYDVWIAYDPTYNIAPVIEYEALAEVELSPKINPVRELLPDLEFRSTERITFDTPSFPTFEPDPPAGESCFNSEKAEDGAQVCLRFDQVVANVGKGQVEIAHTVPAGAVVEDGVEFPVQQRIYNTDGTFADSPAGSVEFHGTHGHYHYSSFANTVLWKSNAQGKRVGNAPVRQNQKVSFCMADIKIDKWGEKGDGPRRYYAPDCLFPATSDANGDYFKQGIQAGWSDVYDWYIPDQYIEVSGLANGYYRLEFCADPDNEIEETDEDNNCFVNHIRLQDIALPTRSVTVLGAIDEDDDCDHDHGHGHGHGGHGHGHGHGHGGHGHGNH